MPGNSFGKLFVVTTCGESHGPAYACIVDGCPPNLELTEADIQKELDRRRPGQSAFVSQRKEDDRVEIISGVFEGKTTGTPIGLLIRNCDARTKDYDNLKNVYRPGHADFTYQAKYGIRDHRGGGRASARETMMRVAAGAIAKKFLTEKLNVKIQGYLAQLGPIIIENKFPQEIYNNPFFCPDPSKLNELENFIEQLRKNKDSIGARINIIVTNMPVGLGEPVFDKLNASLAHALMSINAVKGVEIGDGFQVVTQKGSEHRDEITQDGFASNHSGGTLGGISTGQSLLISMALKPTSSIPAAVNTITLDNEETTINVKGRHDPCVGLRATPIAEAMVALTLIDHYLINKVFAEPAKPSKA